MALYVVNVPDPPAGEDWTQTVPGQYRYHVTSVSATLTPPADPLIMADSSGNGFDGTYNVNPPGSPFVAGLIPGANGALWQNTAAPDIHNWADTPNGIMDFAGPMTFDCWQQGVPGFQFLAFFAPVTFAHVGFSLIVQADGTVVLRRNDGINAIAWESVAGAFPIDGTNHHLAASYDGAAGLVYVDGVDVTAFTIGTDPTSTAGANAAELGRIAGGGPAQETWAIQGQPAFYDVALTGGQIAAHAAAGASLATYNAAVLADSPVAYYEFADVAIPPTRTVVFDVTDGSNDVIEIAPPTPNAGTGPKTYSWLPQISNDFTNADGTVTIVGIPDLVIPAGYTIGTRTLGIRPFDQWSNISVWWSDDRMPPPAAATTLAGYRSVLLLG